MAYRLGCNNTMLLQTCNHWRLCLHVHIGHMLSKDENIPYAWAQGIWVLQACFILSSYSCKQLTMNTLSIEAKIVYVVQLGMHKYSPQSP